MLKGDIVVKIGMVQEEFATFLIRSLSLA